MKNIKSLGNISLHFLQTHEFYTEVSLKLYQFLRHKIAKHKILLLLSGGSAVSLYFYLAKYLSSLPKNSGNLYLAQVDERYFLKEDTSREINAEAIRETGIWDVSVRRGIGFYPVSQKKAFLKAVYEYNQTISKLFKICDIKIAVLGIGEDCHTAGMLPGYETKWNKKKYVVGYENDGQFKRRITLAPFALRQIEYCLVAVTGKNKKKALMAAVAKKNKYLLNQYPAAILQQMKRVDIFYSQSAASVNPNNLGAVGQ